jgi:sodium-dependent phosphate cotransporter
VNGLIAMLIGAGITMLVQSSSITTSVLTPLVGVGCIQLEQAGIQFITINPLRYAVFLHINFSFFSLFQMLPLTLGANIGTTITGLLAAMVADTVDALQVALCHLFFNISGIVIWYPLPFMRKIPLNGARVLGRATRRSKLVPPIYIILVFFVIPLLLLAISSLFEQKTVGFTVLGSFVVVIVAGGIAKFVWWWKKQDGHNKCLTWMDNRTARSECHKTLPEDMQFLKSKVNQLCEHTGLLADEEDVEEGVEKPLMQEVAAADLQAIEDDENEA